MKIVGFGSLLSPSSAATTFSAIRDFGVARVRNFARCFNHPSPRFFFQNDLVDSPHSKEVSSLDVIFSPGASTLVSIFDVPEEDLPAYYERECRYYIIRVVVEVLGEVEETSGERSVLEESEALMCCSFLGIDAMQAYAKSGGQLCVAGSAPDTRNTAEEEEKEEQEEKAEEYLCHPVQTIVRTPDSFPTYCAEVLPNRYYLKHCYVAASRLGDDVLLNFVEESYLGDESTPLRELLEQAEWKDFVHKTPWPTHFPRYCG